MGTAPVAAFPDLFANTLRVERVEPMHSFGTEI